METIVKKSKAYASQVNFGQIKKWINNPYFSGVLVLLVVVYGSFMAPQLPHAVAKWFGNPIFKLAFAGLIIFAHRVNPVISIVLALAFIISIQTVSRFGLADRKEHALQVQQAPYQRPSVAESVQLNQEIKEDIEQRQMMGHTEPIEEPQPVEQEGLHPLNRPTPETELKDERIEDPDDPRQPSLQMMNDPNLNVAIYELNPPFAHKELPMGEGQLNVASINMPKGGPTRYSAYHGYTIA